ncbi:MAG: type IX secretion system sortase PorU [Lutimonas sp.]
MRVRALSFLLFLLFTVWSHSQVSGSQSFVLEWDQTQLRSPRYGIDLSVPSIRNQGFDANALPTYSASFNVQNKGIVLDYQIINVKFSSISGQELSGVRQEEIPASLDPRFTLSTVRGRTIGTVDIHPLIRQDGQVKKVVSFTLEYSMGSGGESSALNRSTLASSKDNSVLGTGSWYKFRIDTTGIFKIDKELLEAIGINTSGLDPRNIRIYGNGGAMLPQRNDQFRYDDLEENALFIEGEQDGEFDDSDYILFYGQGPENWTVDSSDFFETRHETNLYSDHAYYFITADLGQGKRITNLTPVDESATVVLNSYHDFALHEIDQINLFSNGQQWLGEDFSFQDAQNFSFEFTGLDTSQELSIRLRGAAISFSNTSMTASLNGTPLVNLSFRAQNPNSLTLASTDEESAAFNSSSELLQIQITYDNGGNPSSRAYLDYIEILGSKNLVARDQQFGFRNVEATSLGTIYEYVIQNAANVTHLWDVTDPLNPGAVANLSAGSDFRFRFRGGELREYVLSTGEDFKLPEALENSPIENQNLHALKDLDYLIITRDYLIGEAERIADYHREQSNLNVAVVDLEHVYNEFSSGSPDLTAIRDFVRHLYLNSNPDRRIRYLCLFGDASFDFKDRISDNNNIVPAFQSFESFNLATSYVTDDYFGMMDDTEGELVSSDKQDVATGRFVVTTLSEAREAVNKTLQYYSESSFGDWRNTVTFVADDPDEPNEFILQQTVDLIAQEVESTRPEFNLKKIYSDAYPQESTAGGERYPGVNQAIDNAVESGSLVLDYFGHGGVNGWANERILEVPQVQNWSNYNTLPLFITVTCEFARFDNPLRPTAGEFALLNRDGGPVTLISTTREIFISVGQVFNRTLFEELFDPENENSSISEALMYSKQEFGSPQRLFVYFFGDPAMSLALGKPSIKLTRINGKDIVQQADTLKALSKVNLEGVVTDAAGNPASNFNGTLSATIFDKSLDKSTLDNDNFGRKMEFSSIESKIFRGRASVTDGKFAFEFIVPRDIRIAYGQAKISLYADNQLIDKAGADQTVVVGGVDPNAPEDNQGPAIQLFMNDESFVDGGNTSSSPLLYAILEDESGINTSITSVDHDIIAILDDDNANPYVLNDYYETELDDFKKGKVKFPFRELEPGLHTVKFKCWDTYNNPSESTLSFIVVNDNDLILSNVLNYPNPFVNYTEFWFNHNKPNEALEVQVQIFTISGKLVKTLNQSVQSDGLLSREISWNGLDDFGNKIGKGVYVYRLHVRSVLSNASAEKFEKLVILQ